MPHSSSWSQADVGAAGSRPGFYVNLVEAAAAAVLAGPRGVVGIISESDWGPPNTIQTLDTLSEAATLYTDIEDATARLYNLIRFAFLGGASEVKVARVMNTTAAVAALLNLDDSTLPTDVIRVSAKYEGTYGNSISVDVAADPVDALKIRVRIFVDSELVHSVTGTINNGTAGNVDDLVAQFVALDSDWITVTKLADGDNELADLAEANLATGANGDAVTVTEFGDVLDIFAAERIHLITTDSNVTGVQAAVAAWVDEQREGNAYVMGVVGSATAATVSDMRTAAQTLNNPAMVYVGPGATLPDVAGVSASYNGGSISAIVAGLIAGNRSRNSVTFAGIPRSTGVETYLTNAQIQDLLSNGVCVITSSPPSASPTARVERGLTTLYSLVEGDITSFKKIRTVRIMDAIGEGLSDAALASFIGIQLDDAGGRQAIIGAVRDFLQLQAEAQLIDPVFTASFDEELSTGDGALFLNISVKPIDAVEYIYSVITVGNLE